MMRKLAELKDWQTFVNRKIWNTRYALIDKEQFPIVRSKTGELFYIHPDLCTYTESLNQYSLKGLRKSDVVVDIGANIGAFSIMAAKHCRVVHAFEPVEYETLEKNVQLNWPANEYGFVYPHKIALGYSGGKTIINWQGKHAEVETKTLTEIKKISVGCDYLKIDAEGAEWNIKPEELADIRRIEIEFHNYHKNVTEHGLVYQISEMFNCTSHYGPKTDTYWISGVNKDERL